MVLVRDKVCLQAHVRKRASSATRVLPLLIVFLILSTLFREIPYSNLNALATVTPARPPLSSNPTAVRLIVMTMDRAKSLTRLLDSAARARYHRNRVDIDIWVDRRPGTELNKDVLNVVHTFSWPHGTKTVYERNKPGGLYAQWLETWDVDKALNTGEFAVFLEDDLDLSPTFYEWLLEARRRYASDHDVAGFTLQRSSLRPRPANAKNNHLRLPPRTPAFKFRLHGSWGFAPSPAVWRDFLGWYMQMRRDRKTPYVDNLITTNWYRGQENKTLGFAPSMWTQWFIKYSDAHNLFTVTPRLLDGTTLAANWKEPGLHFAGKKASRKDYKVFEGSANSFLWPYKLLKIDWDGTVIRTDSASVKF